MEIFWRFCVFVFLCVALLFAGSAFYAHAQTAALEVFDKYFDTFRHPDVHEHFPDVLRAFKKPEIQNVLNSVVIHHFVRDPKFIRAFSPETDDSILVLLLLDDQFRALFEDDQFHAVLQNPTEIDKLVRLIQQTPPHYRDPICPIPAPEPEPQPPRATTLTIVSGNNQSGEVGKPLAQPFVVGVLDQEAKPLQGIAITFRVTAGNGRLSATRQSTDVYGQARTILTLGSGAGRHSVIATVSGIRGTQTFTATAHAPPPPKEPEPVVLPPSTAEPPLPPMYWIEGNRIYYLPIGGKKTILEPKGGVLTGGLAVDTVGRKVYWTELTTGTNAGSIRSADLNGTNPATVKSFPDPKALPLDIALDAVGGKLYWTNGFGIIQRFDLTNNRHDHEFKNITGLEAPKHIAFDVETGKLYWTETDLITRRDRIKVTDPNHQRVMLLVATDLNTLGGIAVYDDVVYWTEQTRDGSGSVRSMHRPGKDHKLLAVAESIPIGIAVDPVGERVYWTTADGQIQSVLLTGATRTVVTVFTDGVGPATGIALGETAAPGAPTAPSVNSTDAAVSVENTLLANYPNPFNPETWIPYQLSASADVSVSIYAVDGRLVRRLDLGHQSAGVYRSRSRAAYWDGHNEFGEPVASGLYFYTLTAGDFTATRKMLIRK